MSTKSSVSADMLNRHNLNHLLEFEIRPLDPNHKNKQKELRQARLSNLAQKYPNISFKKFQAVYAKQLSIIYGAKPVELGPSLGGDAATVLCMMAIGAAISPLTAAYGATKSLLKAKADYREYKKLRTQTHPNLAPLPSVSSDGASIPAEPNNTTPLLPPSAAREGYTV